MNPELDIGNEDRVARAKPAPLQSRILAGAFDLIVIIVSSFVLILGELFVVGATLPMVCVTVVGLLYAVLPLWLFKATAGMRLFGIQLVGKGGRSVDLVDILVRELLGRGLLPVAFLATLGLSLVSGMGVVTTPGLAVIGVFGSLGFLGMVGMGHLLAVIREDGRGLADLLARSMVVPKLPAPTYVDEDDRLEKRAARSRQVRNFAIACVVLVFGTVAGPKVLFGRRQSGMDTLAERTEARRSENLWLAAKADEALAAKAMRGQYNVGNRERAEEIRKEWLAAKGDADKSQVAALVALSDKEPANEYATRELLEKYEAQGMVNEARALLERHARSANTADARLWYGSWLYDESQLGEAETVLRAMLSDGMDDESVRAYLGWTLKEQGRFEEARTEFEAALAHEPELEDVQESLSEINELIGAKKPPAPAKQPAKKRKGASP